MYIFQMSIEIGFVRKYRRAYSTRKTNTIVIFLMSNQITFTREHRRALLAFKHFLYNINNIFKL